MVPLLHQKEKQLFRDDSYQCVPGNSLIHGYLNSLNLCQDLGQKDPEHLSDLKNSVDHSIRPHQITQGNKNPKCLCKTCVLGKVGTKARQFGGMSVGLHQRSKSSFHDGG